MKAAVRLVHREIRTMASGGRMPFLISVTLNPSLSFGTYIGTSLIVATHSVTLEALLETLSKAKNPASQVMSVALQNVPFWAFSCIHFVETYGTLKTALS